MLGKEGNQLVGKLAAEAGWVQEESSVVSYLVGHMRLEVLAVGGLQPGVYQRGLHILHLFHTAGT